MDEKFLSISYFDQIVGPNILYCLPDKPVNDLDFPDLPRILEFTEQEGTFLFSFRRF